MERLQEVKATLQRAHCPAVMVLADQSLEASCLLRNGLSLAELLRPFGVIRQLNGTVGGGWCRLPATSSPTERILTVATL